MTLMTTAYDPANIFARILRGEVPCRKVCENAHALAFHDAFPKAPIHILVVPKGSYVSYVDFFAKASGEELSGLAAAITEVCELFPIERDGSRLICNQGQWGGQEVPHFHIHLLGGKPLGPMVGK